MSKELTGAQCRSLISGYLSGVKIDDVICNSGVGSRKTLYYVLRIYGIKPQRKVGRRKKCMV